MDKVTCTQCVLCVTSYKSNELLVFCYKFISCSINTYRILMKKALGEMQTLRVGRSNVEPKIFAPPQTPALHMGARQPKFNHLEMLTTFTYRPSLVKIDARNFELSW